MNSLLRWFLTILRYYKHLRAAQNPAPGPNPRDLETQLWAQRLLTRGTGCPSRRSRPTSQPQPDVEVQAFMVMQKHWKNSGKQYQQVFKLLRKQVSEGVSGLDIFLCLHANVPVLNLIGVIHKFGNSGVSIVHWLTLWLALGNWCFPSNWQKFNNFIIYREPNYFKRKLDSIYCYKISYSKYTRQ